MSGFSALILAGSRGGDDPVAAYAGVPHKALIDLDGRSLLTRVIDALRAAGAGRIAVSTDSDEVRRALDGLSVEVLAAAAGPSLSVRQAAEAMGTPLLVTTADHALLQPEWITSFLADRPPEADICALLARRRTVEAHAPATERTYLRLADDQWSGCNLFYLANDRALGAVDFWRRLEAERKRPWRMAGLIGAGALVAYTCGRLTLQQAVGKLGARAGVVAAAVESPYGLAAVDVDKPADLDLVRGLVGS